MIIRSISLEKDLNEKIQKYCINSNKNISELIARLLIKYMEQEDGARKESEE